MYGTDIIPETQGAVKGKTYNPIRGKKVIEYARNLLDMYVPLKGESWKDLTKIPEVINNKIPLFVYLRGNIWLEHKWAKETIYKDPVMRAVANQRHKIANEVFEKCDGVFMTADYLHDVIREHHPNTKTFHFLEGFVQLVQRERGLFYP